MQEKLVSPTALQGSGFSIDDAAPGQHVSWRRGPILKRPDCFDGTSRLNRTVVVCFVVRLTVQLREEHEMLHRTASATATPKRTHASPRQAAHAPTRTSQRSGYCCSSAVAQLEVILDITRGTSPCRSRDDLQLTGSIIGRSRATRYLAACSCSAAARPTAREAQGCSWTGSHLPSSHSLRYGRHCRAPSSPLARPGLGRGCFPGALAIIMSAFQGTRRAKALAALGRSGRAGACDRRACRWPLTEFHRLRIDLQVNLPSLPPRRSRTEDHRADTKKPRW